jgi:hypothetical protein
MKRLLEANGWTETAGGRHVVKMTKPGHRPITLPHGKSGGGYPIGLAMAIMLQVPAEGPGGRELRHRRDGDVVEFRFNL